MKLSHFVAAQRSVIPLETSSLPGAASILLERLEQAGAIADMEKLRDRVAEERPEDIVAMGDRAFLLHYRTDAVRELVVALGTAREPICRELAEHGEQCARIVLLIVSPPRMAARYLQVVGAFARLFSDPEVVELVLGQRNAEALEKLDVFAQHDLPEQLFVRDIMTYRARTVSPDTPLRDAARDMVRAGVEGLPVVDEEGRLVGMLSERELLQHLLHSQLIGGSSARAEATGASARRTVRDVMTRQVLCVSADQPLAEVASLMSNKELDRVPVVQSGRLVGVLTRGDIVRKLIGS